MTKIITFAGSRAEASVNAKLAKAVAAQASMLGAQAEFLDISAYELPLYDSDLEATDGIPENAVKLKEILQSADGVFIASPEYNSSFSPLLKNVIDWVSRVRDEGEPMLAAYVNKVYAIGAASPGGLGGIRGLVPLRMLLGNIGITMTPSQIAIGGAFKAFNDDLTLADEGQAKMLTSAVQERYDGCGL